MRIRNVFLLLCLCFFEVQSYAAETIVTRAGSGSVCPDAEILIPITVQKFNKVGSVSLALEYDNTKVTYAGYDNMHTEVGGMLINPNNGKVYFAWSSINSATIDDNDTLVNLRFRGIEGSSALTWQTTMCEYTDTLGVVIPSTYNNGSVGVYVAPTITSQPSNMTVATGQNTSFAVTAIGQGITYQWQSKEGSSRTWVDVTNGEHYANATTRQLSVNNVTMQMNGMQFRCVVSGTCTTPAYSNAATMTVVNYIPTITTKVESTTSCQNTTFVIPITVTNCNNVGAFSLAMTYNADKVTYLGYQNAYSMLGGDLAVNASNGVVYFTWSSASQTLNLGSGTLLEFLFEAEPANSVFLWNTTDCEYSDPSGNALPTSFTTGSVTVYYKPHIDSNPVNRSINEGASTTFSVSAGGQGISYTWQVSSDGWEWTNLANGTNYANVASSTLTVRNVTAAMDGLQYRCVVCGTCDPCAYSSAATLHVNVVLPTIATSITGFSTCPHGDYATPITVNNFINVGSISLALAYNNAVLTYVGIEDLNPAITASELIVNASNGTVYITWASINGATIDNGGTLMKLVFNGNTGSTGLNWNTNNCEYTTPTGMVFPSTYSNASATIYQDPTVTGNPENRCIVEGQNTTFVVSGSGQNLSCQWQVMPRGSSSWSDLANGDHYSNVTSGTLRVNNATVSMDGNQYRCRLSGLCGSPAYSNAAMLEVDPVIEHPTVIAENTEQGCTGTVTQNVLVEHFNNIGALSLVMEYDTNFLRYLEIPYINPALSQDNFVVNYAHGKIYIVYSSTTAINLGSATLFQLKFDSSGGQSTNSWKTDQCEVADVNGNVISPVYTNGYIKVTSDCMFGDIFDSEWALFIMDLCERGIVSGYDCMVMPNQAMKRSQMAKMLFIALYGSPNASVVTDNFPSPFLDLQNSGTYYYKYAKALSYLEYKDGVSPFDRNKLNFNPEGNIERMYAIKALLETFNIPPLLEDTVIFADVPLTHNFRGYINRAYKMGLLMDVSTEPSVTKYFHPNANCIRGDFMLYLDVLLNVYQITRPNNSQNLGESDYFIPGNYTPYNFTSVLGQEMGNFNHTTKSSFNIPARGFPLKFEHTYNSFLTELPSQILATNPLGMGWSHNYNSYIINTDEILDDYGHPLVEPCLIIFWADGTLHVYDNENAPVHPKAITKGVYSKVTKVNDSQYTVKMKDQTVVTFTKISGSADDAPYMMTRMEDLSGNATTLTYSIGEDNRPRLTTVSDNAGRDLVFTYHPNSNYLKKVTDPLNRSVSFVVEDDNLTAYVNAKGDSTLYFYDTLYHYNHLLDSIRLPKGNFITNKYEQRKLTSTKFNNGSSTTIQHNANYVANANVFYSSMVTESMGGSVVNSNYQYDKNGKQTHFSVGNTSDVTKTYDTADPNLVTSIKNNKTGMIVKYEYDSVANVTKMIREGGNLRNVVQYEYDAENNLTRQIDAKGNVTEYTYENGNVKKLTNAMGQEILYSYNGYGQPYTVTDPLGNQVMFGYDGYGNNNSINYQALGMSASATFDIAGRMISATDFNGYTKSYEYDEVDALVKETNAMGYETTFAFDKNGNMTSICNAKGDSTLFTYDFDNDFLLSMSFQGVSKRYSYNEDGSLKTITTPNGDVFTFSYDDQGRTLSDGVASYAYNSSGNLERVTKNGMSISYNYDIFNRMISQTYDGQMVEYSYDDNDNVVELTYPGNHIVQYGYNAINQLVSVTDWNGHVTTYDYNSNGSLKSILYPNQMISEYHYDVAGRVVGMGSKRNNGTDIVQYQFDLDNNGNHLSALALEQFIEMPMVEMPNVSYDYNAANRLVSDGTNNYQYDYNGNMTAKGSYGYHYDAMNNLTSYRSEGDFSFTYDGQGNRRTAMRNGELTKFILDDKGSVLAELNSANEVKCYYVYGRGLISRIKSDNTTQYYVCNYQGSVVAMVDDTEEAVVTHKYQYDAFGNIIQKEETDFNPFRYLGKYGVMYEDSCLYYMYARYYDPTIARFLSEDPIWSTNLYAYADNNPITRTDFSGRKSQIIQELGDAWDDSMDFWAEFFVKTWDGFIDKTTSFCRESIAVAQTKMDKELAKEKPNWFRYYSLAACQGLCDVWVVDEYRNALLWAVETVYGGKVLEYFGGKLDWTFADYGLQDGKWVTKLLGKTGKLKLINMTTKYGVWLKKQASMEKLIPTLFDFAGAKETVITNLKAFKESFKGIKNTF